MSVIGTPSFPEKKCCEWNVSWNEDNCVPVRSVIKFAQLWKRFGHCPSQSF